MNLQQILMSLTIHSKKGIWYAICQRKTPETCEDPLRGESIGHRWIPLVKAKSSQVKYVLLPHTNGKSYITQWS